MKKIVCGCFGTIYYAQILKDGMMSSSNREDVTDDAINAVLTHIMATDGYIADGYGGYGFKSDDTQVELVAYDKRKWKLVKNEVTE